jgi:hypothetical protein
MKNDLIFNSKTKRWVKKNGRIGKQILAEAKKNNLPTPKKRSPTPKKRSPTPKKRSPTPKKRSPTPKRKSPTPKNDMEILKNIIDNNKYCKTCKINVNRDKNSFSFLVDRKITQSDSIKLGTAVENILREIIIRYTDVINIKQKNVKGVKEKDHLFKSDPKKKIYYAEIKANLNLDTEKSVATLNKVIDNHSELEKQYPDYDIESFLVNTRYLNKIDIPRTIFNKYKKISDNVVGVNEYLESMGSNFIFRDIDMYKEFLNYLYDKCFCMFK